MITKNDSLLLEYRTERDSKKKRRLADKLVRQNQALVYQMVKKFSRWVSDTVDFDDLMQAGYIAFLYTIDNIDMSRTFSTYYAYRVWYEVSKLAEKSGVVNKPRARGLSGKILREIDKFRAKNGREPTAEELGVKPEKLDRWLETVDMVPLPEDCSHDTDALAEYDLTDLPEGEQKILGCVLSGQTLDEVARQLKMPLPWVESSFDAAIGRLA